MHQDWKKLASQGAVGIALIQSTIASAALIVPADVASTDGNSNNSLPFDATHWRNDLTTLRYQQVFAASPLGAGARMIFSIAFRPDSQWGLAFDSTLADAEISLSTTSKPVDGLSTTFADNIGPDLLVVHCGSLELSSNARGPREGPKEFDIIIPFEQPFLYDPAKGNLLLDVKNLSTASATVFDAVQSTSDAVSRVYSDVGDGLDAYRSTGRADTIGLVVRFETMPAPEAGFPAAILGGGLTLLMRRKT